MTPARFTLSSTLGSPSVTGDWVKVVAGEIVVVQPRHACRTRPDPHLRDVKVLAANIDTVVIVIAIDLGLNLKALERLVIMAWDSGAAPVVVLTRCDGALDVSAAVHEARAVAPMSR